MKNVRMQFDLTEERVRELEELMSRCNVSTKKELINYALTMLEWAVSENELGHDVAAIDRENKQIFSLRMPIFKKVARCAAQ